MLAGLWIGFQLASDWERRVIAKKQGGLVAMAIFFALLFGPALVAGFIVAQILMVLG